MSITEKSVRCNCIGGEHYLHFTIFSDEYQVYVDLMSVPKPRFWERVKQAVDILLNKEVLVDDIILNEQKSKEICDFLTEYWRKVNEQNTK